jgi:DNA-binding HxlR family transcriptional regulator
MEEEGFIECVEKKRQQPLMVVWRAEKGRDTLPILMQLTAFGLWRRKDS